MNYRLRIDVGRYKKGDIVNVQFKELKSTEKSNVLFFTINGARYGIAEDKDKCVKTKLMNKVFYEL